MSIRAITDENNDQKQNLHVKDITCNNLNAGMLQNKHIVCGNLSFIDLINPYVEQLHNQNQYYLLSPQTTILSNNLTLGQNYMVMPSNGRIQYSGPNQLMVLDFTCSLNVNVSSDIYMLSVFKNGQITNLQCYFDFIANNVAISSSIHSAIEMSTGDVLDIRAQDITNVNRVLRIFNYHLVLSGTQILL